jgi:DMSO/TMAO reductase YedYZ molybdopterin-dependent catalytic subunit
MPDQPNNSSQQRPLPEIDRVSFAERLRNTVTEGEPPARDVDAKRLKRLSRRDFLLFAAGAGLTAAGFLSTLPQETQQAIGFKKAVDTPRKERLLNMALNFDDDVAEALYSRNRVVPVYDSSRALSPDVLINNYNGPTPDPGYISTWRLKVAGLESGRTEYLTIGDIANMTRRFGFHDEVTRLVCVEGWSAIAWWGGLRFADLMRAYPPAAGATWARLDSSVNLGTDDSGNSISDPYYVAIDLPTALHPQTLLATHQSSQPLTVGHGAPLRLIAPMKLGLKNIKAITSITYVQKTPADYWNDRGYSQYDGL